MYSIMQPKFKFNRIESLTWYTVTFYFYVSICKYALTLKHLHNQFELGDKPNHVVDKQFGVSLSKVPERHALLAIKYSQQTMETYTLSFYHHVIADFVKNGLFTLRKSDHLQIIC